MANPRHLEILNQGVDAWNRWRDETPHIQPDLDGVALDGANLAGVNLSWTKLRSSVLKRSKLQGAVFLGANCSASDFTKADLRETLFSAAYMNVTDFREANLSRANLLWATFNQVRLQGANLEHTLMGSTILGDTDLRAVKGLETVHHNGPSVVGLDTIYRSNGEIPETFLRGAGVPELFIECMRSITGKPEEFYSCFISYSHQDKPFAERLYADLQAKGVRTWYFPEDAAWGELVWGEIDRTIRAYDKLVVVCSEHSLQSGPVLREIERGLLREDIEGMNVLFPIRVDNFIFDQWDHPRKADVCAKVVGDFSGWDRSANIYDGAFQKLLKTLQARSKT